MPPGTRVQHPTYGDGIVTRTRNDGFFVEVRFDSRLVRWLRADEVLPVVAPPRRPPSGPPLRRPAAPTMAPPKARRIIEALRMGIVPRDCAHEFTFGREAEIARLSAWISDGSEAVFLLIGEYGMGKSHMLDWLEWRALQDGFAIAEVEMDPNETPLYQPKHIYGAVTKTFRFLLPGSQILGDFRTFVRAVLERGGWRDHEYLRWLGRFGDNPAVWRWIAGQDAFLRPFPTAVGGVTLPGLHNDTTAANTYTYLLTAFGWAAVQVLHMKGLLVVFDEAESLSDATYPWQLLRAENFAKALVRVAQGDAEMLGVPSQTGLRYGKRGPGKRIPFLYRKPSGLKLLFAFTPSDLVDQIQELANSPRLDVDPLESSALDALCIRIRELYREAYAVEPPELEVVDELSRGRGAAPVRRIAKGAIERLDAARHGISS